MGEVGLGDADRRDIAGRRHQPGGVAAGEGAQVTADQPGLYRAGGTAYLERPGACWRAPGLICLLRDASAPGERAATDDDIDSPYRSLAGKMQVRRRARPPIHMLMLAVPGVRLGSSVASCGTRARRLTGVRHGELPEPSRACASSRPMGGYRLDANQDFTGAYLDVRRYDAHGSGAACAI